MTYPKSVSSKPGKDVGELSKGKLEQPTPVSVIKG